MRVLDLDAADLVGVAEISARTGVKKTTVCAWDRRRATTGFPEPLARLDSGPVYAWPDVDGWIKETHRG